MRIHLSAPLLLASVVSATPSAPHQRQFPKTFHRRRLLRSPTARDVSYKYGGSSPAAANSSSQLEVRLSSSVLFGTTTWTGIHSFGHRLSFPACQVPKGAPRCGSGDCRNSVLAPTILRSVRTQVWSRSYAASHQLAGADHIVTTDAPVLFYLSERTYSGFALIDRSIVLQLVPCALLYLYI